MYVWNANSLLLRHPKASLESLARPVYKHAAPRHRGSTPHSPKQIHKHTRTQGPRKGSTYTEYPPTSPSVERAGGRVASTIP